jgi:mono/diheme cytochrome c family protein
MASGWAVALVVLTLATGAIAAPPHFADADDAPAVLHGKQLYMQRCASCHGRALQGQPLWQLDAQGAAHRRAPALDQTGGAWQLPDEDLFVATKFGRSAMPGFKDVLDDRDILSVIAFVKARWPIGLRVVQATRNPGGAGMPANAADADWRLPPDCIDPNLRQP